MKKGIPAMHKLISVVALALAPALFLAAPPAQASFARAELEQMLAPIALYPDSILSHVLIAATYPDEVEEAARWSRRHPDLEGEAAVDAVEDRDWDPSVKALVAFPEILARMDEDMDWTERLGDAFLDQEGEVMDSVQTLRDRAYDAGRLESLEHVRVIREREYIYIEPAVRHVVYIPYYDPWFVYGTWWRPSYPPYCWRTWRGHAVSYYPRGFHWGVGLHLSPTFYFTSFHWPARHVVVTHRHGDDRPLYSGRDVARHDNVRHWRQERQERQQQQQRVERRDHAAGHRGSGARAATGQHRDARAPGRERRGSEVDQRAPDQERRGHLASEGRREAARGQERRTDETRRDAEPGPRVRREARRQDPALREQRTDDRRDDRPRGHERRDERRPDDAGRREERQDDRRRSDPAVEARGPTPRAERRPEQEQRREHRDRGPAVAHQEQERRPTRAERGERQQESRKEESREKEPRGRERPQRERRG